MSGWRTSGRETDRLDQLSVHELRRLLDEGAVDLVDVRQPAEWAEGRVEGASFVTCGELPARLGEVPGDGRPVAVMCGSGFRSVVAASLLRSEGRDRVASVIGGMDAWQAAGLPTVAGE